MRERVLESECGEISITEEALENQRNADSSDGPTSISNDMFDAMARFVATAILVREYFQDIMIYRTKEFSK